ncbi:hypothetical protein G6011_08230 [Alternaria panax]|uniref:Uncharacterized protein n=1 Tax=Alternaria panax TaxID=48097 RepID=A0AAD4FHX1_9PLEO|nr:hypothetical protein G6011_08230 [Alternaria panax]
MPKNYHRGGKPHKRNKVHGGHGLRHRFARMVFRNNSVTDTDTGGSRKNGSDTTHGSTTETPKPPSSSGNATSDSPRGRRPVNYHGTDSQGTGDSAGDHPVSGLLDDVFVEGPRSPRDLAEMLWYRGLFSRWRNSVKIGGRWTVIPREK